MSQPGRRLPVVDDERIQCLIVVHVIERLGYLADGTEDLDGVFLLLAAYPYGAVVLDLSLRAREEVSPLYIVYSSGSDPVLAPSC